MNVTSNELESLLAAPEGKHLEFKEGKDKFDFDRLCKYCVALANEGGGKLILGATDKVPRLIVGTQCFASRIERVQVDLLGRLRMRVDVVEILDPRGRIVVVAVPDAQRGIACGDDAGPTPNDPARERTRLLCPGLSTCRPGASFTESHQFAATTLAQEDRERQSADHGQRTFIARCRTSHGLWPNVGRAYPLGRTFRSWPISASSGTDIRVPHK